MMGFYILAGVIGFFFFMFLLSSIRMVQQSETIVMERLGRYNRVLGPGLHVTMPFMDSPHVVSWSYVHQGPGGKYYRVTRTLSRIDLRESVYDFPKQNVITKDNVTMEINALLYYQITDPKAAVYEVNNLPEAIEKLTQTTLRNVIGSMDLDETLVSRDQINEKLRIILDEATDKWGVKVNRVELQEVNPPFEIREAMEKQMRAERTKRALIIESEGKKRASILTAEGEQESQVLRAQGKSQAEIVNAEGLAQARLKMAEAEAEAINKIKGAAGEGTDPMAYLTALNYIRTLPEMTKGHDNKLIIVPYESSSLVGSLASIKKIFEETK
ncbi:SPFH/Band 7/PHB domain protein [bacterium]|nr:SPFH/Band 7/PHB domain protein [bacterium]MBT5015377.1 SPFH/Band 7/PHB domain protein [bacterium]